MHEKQLLSTIKILEEESQRYCDDVHNEVDIANDFYNGKSNIVPSQDRYSKFTTTDVQDAIEGILPTLVRIFSSGDKIVQFEPTEQQDEELVDQATDYANWVFKVDNNGNKILRNLFRSSLKNRVGYAKIFREQKENKEQSSYEAMSTIQYLQLLQDEFTEIKEHSVYDSVENEIEISDEELLINPQAQFTHNVKAVHTINNSRTQIEFVPVKQIRLSSRTVELNDTPFIQQVLQKTRSDILEMFPDKRKIIDELSYDGKDYDREEIRDFSDKSNVSNESVDKSLDLLEYKETYLRIDEDEDGYAELRKVVIVGDKVLEDEVTDYIPFIAITPIEQEGHFFGKSITDLIKPYQKLNTTLIRQILDNTYLANHPTRELVSKNLGKFTNEALITLMEAKPANTFMSEFGGGLINHPANSISSQVFSLLELSESRKENASGVTRYNQGLDANSLNKTATGISKILTAGQARLELIARTMADQIAEIFNKIFELARKYESRSKIIRLRGKYIEIDPASWVHKMDAKTNVALGTGDREVLQASLLNILNLQEKLFQVNSPMVTDENIYNVLEKFVEATGLRGAETYFTNPNEVTEEKIAEMQQQAQKQQEEQQFEKEVELKKLQQKDEEIDIKRQDSEAKAFSAVGSSFRGL